MLMLILLLLSILLLAGVLLVRKTSLRLPNLVSPIPLLGCAWNYKADPLRYLLQLRHRLGPLFTLDLAGFRVTLLSEPGLISDYHRAGPTVLSSHDALSAVGFSDVLGTLNVFDGTPLHRSILLHMSAPQQQAFLANFKGALQETLRDAIAQTVGPIEDFLAFTRVVVFEATIRALFGPDCKLLQLFPDFSTRFMAFQDEYEQAIATAMVLPHWISKPFILRPLARKRKLLAADVARVLCHSDGTTKNHYIDSLLEKGRERSLSEDDVADLVVGLLTAAPKNVSIVSSQLILFCLENQLLASFAGGDSATRQLFVKETLRLTAMPIGSLRLVVDPEGFTFTDSNGVIMTIPCGSFVAPSPLLVARFRRSDAFAPFLTQPYDFFPFSACRHRCPGERLAFKMIESCCETFISNYKILQAENCSIPKLCFRKATQAQRQGKVKIIIMNK